MEVVQTISPKQIAGLGSEVSSVVQTLAFNCDSDWFLDHQHSPYLPHASVLPLVVKQNKVLLISLTKAQKFFCGRWKPMVGVSAVIIKKDLV